MFSPNLVMIIKHSDYSFCEPLVRIFAIDQAIIKKIEITGSFIWIFIKGSTVSFGKKLQFVLDIINPKTCIKACIVYQLYCFCSSSCDLPNKIKIFLSYTLGKFMDHIGKISHSSWFYVFDSIN